MGFGRVGKHRKHGGGRGNAGGMHHLRILFDRFHPGHFYKIGMRQFHKNKNEAYCPTVNLEKLWTLVSKECYENAKKHPEKATVIDCSRAGLFKVLGKGLLPKLPIIVKAKLFSKDAEKKIKEVGGVCITEA